MVDPAFRIGNLEEKIQALNNRVSKVNPCHESSSGRFCSGAGGIGSGIRAGGLTTGQAAKKIKVGTKIETSVGNGKVTGFNKDRTEFDFVETKKYPKGKVKVNHYARLDQITSVAGRAVRQPWM